MRNKNTKKQKTKSSFAKGFGYTAGQCTAMGIAGCLMMKGLSIWCDKWETKKEAEK